MSSKPTGKKKGREGMAKVKGDIGKKVEYFCVDEIRGPIVIAKGDFCPMYGEIVELVLQNTERTVRGQVIEVSEENILVQTFKGMRGVGRKDISVRFTCELLKTPVSEKIVGRILDGKGSPIDGGLQITGERRNVQGLPIRPLKRTHPYGVIETGVSSIDLLDTFIKGQKLPIFSASGLSHLKLVGQVVENARLHSGEELTVIFGGLGLTFDEYSYIMNLVKETGILGRCAFFLNKANDPVVERIILPRIALTVAEHLAFDLEKNVLVMLYDLSNYADALREISSLRGELPGRMSYPPYLYTDLASILERSGLLEGKHGSLTQMPILTMPNNDITHPIPDLTGYITEGQILLSRELEKEGIYPPIDIIPSLSRMMNKGTTGITREDHLFLSNLLYSAYSKYLKAKKLRLISGEKSLSGDDRKYLEFGGRFERKFINQRQR